MQMGLGVGFAVAVVVVVVVVVGSMIGPLEIFRIQGATYLLACFALLTLFPKVLRKNEC